MGSIVMYENKNRIVEIVNEKEKAQEHITIMLGLAVIMIGVVAFIIKSTVFASMGLTGQTALIAGAFFLFCALIWSLKNDRTESDIKAFTLTGIALIAPALMII